MNETMQSSRESQWAKMDFTTHEHFEKNFSEYFQELYSSVDNSPSGSFAPEFGRTIQERVTGPISQDLELLSGQVALKNAFERQSTRKIQ